LAGARGQTADEIAKALGQAGVDARYHSELAALLGQIVKAGNADGNQFANANRLWLQKDFKILPDFGNTLRTAYGAPAVPVDFARDTESARAEINSWTERQTHGKVRNLFGPGTVNGRTRLVLSSATWFLGKWEHAFRRSDTRPEPFQLSGGDKEQVDFLHQTGRFGYAETTAGQLLEMRYAGGELAFDILLPKEAKGLDIDPGVLPGWLGNLQSRKVQVAVPKFRVESDFSLARTLAAVGMTSAFTSAADFSGIDDRRDLQLSEVVHKAYVDVNEEGTEAAAATGAAVALVSMVKAPEPVFRADHPFLFFIRDTRSGLILFTGRLLNPKR
jgi:serpin B